MKGEEMDKAVLSAKDLTVGYADKAGHRTVVNKADVALMPGELCCLLGPNGAGKSTLLRALAGLRKPFGGEVSLCGNSLGALGPGQKAKLLGMVASRPEMVADMYVDEIVALGRSPYTGWSGKLGAKDYEKVNEAMESTKTSRFTGRTFSSLSDGEKQRVLIARVLAQDTDVILLDEPTAHLDLPGRAEIMLLLKSLAHSTGKAVLMSTHDPDMATQVADRLWLMPGDGAVLCGTPEQLVSGGDIAKAFETDWLEYDYGAGRFRIREGYKG
ncbi:iron(III) ABC transporter ATP-binding protein (plasmid) [Fulvitalea axinellae]|uniref:Iron(III) ABC transporter ATP-binding protein n=1 Tax=Fulvitalea axinellae TaxID=1182444 RepID=A0AAU9CJC9_9BACT|nr:iron(III) ABC transporter ATP-binding protein [Fulvitalea axinellae]